MRRMIVRLLTLAVLLTAMALPMTACADETERLVRMDDEKRAERLMVLTQKAIENTSCVRFKRSVDIRNPYYASFHTETETVTCIEGDDGITYISSSKDKTKLVTEGTFINRKWGYVDGTFFTCYEEGGNESRYKAPMTQSEFEASYLEDGVWGRLSFLFDELSCTTFTSEHKENGAWMATYEGFSEGETNSFLKELGYIPAFMTDSHDPKDMLVTLHMDADLRPVCLMVEVQFHQNKKYSSQTPSVKVTYDFLAWDTAEVSDWAKTENLTDYTELPDMAVLDAFFGGLTDWEQGSGCAVTVTTATTATGRDENGQPTSVTGELTQDINFSTPGGLRFNMEYEQDGKRYELAYAGGDLFQTVYGKSGSKLQSKSMKMLDAQAYDTVKNLINPMQISPADVTTAEILNQGHGLYRYKLDDDVISAIWSSLQAIYGDADIKTVDTEAELEAEVRNGMLVGYTVTISAELTVNGIPVFTDTTVTVAFAEI